MKGDAAPRRNVGFRFDISARGGHESRGRGRRSASGWDPPLRAFHQAPSFPPPIAVCASPLPSSSARARFSASCLTTASLKAVKAEIGAKVARIGFVSRSSRDYVARGRESDSLCPVAGGKRSREWEDGERKGRERTWSRVMMVPSRRDSAPRSRFSVCS